MNIGKRATVSKNTFFCTIFIAIMRVVCPDFWITVWCFTCNRKVYKYLCFSYIYIFLHSYIHLEYVGPKVFDASFVGLAPRAITQYYVTWLGRNCTNYKTNISAFINTETAITSQVTTMTPTSNSQWIRPLGLSI